MKVTDHLGTTAASRRPGSELSGLERLEAGLASSGDAVPFAELVGMRLAGAAPGEVTVVAEWPGWMEELAATVTPGPVAILADSAGGFSVLTNLAAGRVSVSSQLRVDFVGTPRAASGEWACHAVNTDAAGDVALSHGEVRDGTGAVVGRSTLWSAVIDSPSTTRLSKERPATGEGMRPPESSAAVGPGARPILDLDVWGRFDVACVMASEGRSLLWVPPANDLMNSVGSMHGGAVALFCDLATAVALASSDLEVRPQARRLWMHMDYLRPVLMDGPSRFRAEVVWRSRRLALVDGEVTGPGGLKAARIRQATLL
jgi:acyl-coenzyme A thioesterase PaaI-like protein